VVDIRQWLDQYGLGKYVEVFAENDIGLDVLPKLTEAHLDRLGISLGDQVRLRQAIDELTGSNESAADRDPLRASPAPSGEAEHRQLTVLFCDLVESTELSQQLDLEDLREVNRTYQDAAKASIEQHGGYVARYMGDGVLAYFGYPVAKEDDAERAVRAGLELARVVPTLNSTHKALSVRVGIATGPVVVGDLIGEGASQESAVVGETPNLAARLQAVAEPDTVVISAATHVLVSGFFEFEHLGEQGLKGFSEAQNCWQVLGESRTESRFEALHNEELSGFIGRRSELALLRDRWEVALGGEGQVVLLCGEPGIGKSRLHTQLRHSIVQHPYVQLNFQCSPQHAHSTYFPFIGQLQYAARIEREDDPNTRLDKLEAIVEAPPEAHDRTLALFAALLSLPTTRYPPLELSPAQRKQATMHALVAELRALCEEGPVLAIFEDVHWIDPTSREVVDALVDAVRKLPTLFVITHRPEFASAWRAHGHVTELTLNRLPERDGTSIIREVAGSKRLPETIEGQILERSDGVPLFVEELTRTVLAGGLLREESTEYVIEGPSSELAIPSTLHSSLMARLDRHSVAKEIAQVGACIGREFTYELIEEVADRAAELPAALTALEADQIIFRRGTPPEATYTFKHALVQGVAYDSLLRQTRQAVHARVATVLEERFPDVAAQQPEVVAFHAAEGGLPETGARFRLAAASLASERSAAVDVVAHLTEALRLVDMCLDTDERARQELEILVRLGAALAVQKGYSAPEVEETYERARKLAELVGDRDKLFATTWGLWLINQTRSRYEQGHRLAEELLHLGRTNNDPALMLEAHHAAWTTLASVPRLAECLAHAEKGIVLYDTEAHREHKFIYAGHDPGVCARTHEALMSWLLGFTDRAKRQIEEALVSARALKHGPSLVAAEAFASWVYQFSRDPHQARNHAEAAIALSEEQSLSPQHASVSRVIQGWALVAQGETDAGFLTAWKGMKEVEAIGYRIRRPYLLGVIADACLGAGRVEEGLEVTREALAEPGGWWIAEIHRLEGELLLVSSSTDREKGEASLRNAYDIAEGQDANSLKLRASTSLARLCGLQQRRREALEILAPVYGWFTEGLDTPDLAEAKSLLDELS